MTKFKVMGRPQPKQRARVTKWGSYTPPQTVAYEKLVALTWGNRPMLHGAVAMRVTCVFKIPKSRKDLWSGQNHTQRPDLDNVIKAITDGLNKYAFADDSQIVELIGTKQWGRDEYVEIELEEVDFKEVTDE